MLVNTGECALGLLLLLPPTMSGRLCMGHEPVHGEMPCALHNPITAIAIPVHLSVIKAHGSRPPLVFNKHADHPLQIYSSARH
jgi:hypothetical protein